MSSNSWGDHFWYVIHSVARDVPHQPSVVEKESAETFFYNLGQWLPCQKCRNHFNEFWIQDPLKATTKIETLNWVNRLKLHVDKVKDIDFQIPEKSKFKPIVKPVVKNCTGCNKARQFPGKLKYFK